MLKRLNRLRRMWSLSRKDPEYIDQAMAFKKKEIEDIPDAGDGGGVFIGEGTPEEFARFEKEQKGLKGIFGTD